MCREAALRCGSSSSSAARPAGSRESSGRGAGITAGAAKAEFVSSLGATHVTYGEGAADRIAAVAPNGVDAVLGMVGGDSLHAIAPLAADRSRVVTAVDPTAASELGGGYYQVTQSQQTLTPLAELVASGALDPHVTQENAVTARDDRPEGSATSEGASSCPGAGRRRGDEAGTARSVAGEPGLRPHLCTGAQVVRSGPTTVGAGAQVRRPVLGKVRRSG
ncbi:zinc-binding dehydrogenase [Streptomyces caniscabiei]|uniref:zinc-binding dehydrogenase n=1 Tax=Streptomyces caniscabiei TaxID=2746961 RepID=UPI0009A11C7E|nr:zinc-binding dehydrogenase [Streptomyces caniscabiei]